MHGQDRWDRPWQADERDPRTGARLAPEGWRPLRAEGVPGKRWMCVSPTHPAQSSVVTQHEEPLHLHSGACNAQNALHIPKRFLAVRFCHPNTTLLTFPLLCPGTPIRRLLLFQFLASAARTPSLAHTPAPSTKTQRALRQTPPAGQTQDAAHTSSASSFIAIRQPSWSRK